MLLSELLDYEQVHYYIYRITNTINGKIYIGKRHGKLSEPYYGSGKWIKRAVAKYGVENFTREILMICEKNDWHDAEKRAIKHFHAQDPTIGYNFADGGEGGDMYKGRGWQEISTPDVYAERLRKKAERDKTFWSAENRVKLSVAVKNKQWSGERGDTRRKTQSSRVSGANNPSARVYRLIKPDGSYFDLHSIKQWCIDNDFVYNTVLRYVGKGKIQRSSPKDTSFFQSFTKRSLTGWEIIDITDNKE